LLVHRHVQISIIKVESIQLIPQKLASLKLLTVIFT